MRLESLTSQVTRLYSSKTNPGKQVAKLTNQLHTLKQVVVAFAIVLLIGQANFRSDFRCEAAGSVDWKSMTDFCLLNGTTTVESHDYRPVSREASSAD